MEKSLAVIHSEMELQPLVTNPDRWDGKLARGVSNVLSPPVAATAGIILTAIQVATYQAWLWSAAILFSTVLLPTLYVVYLVRSHRVTDFHIPIRSQRIRPMLFMVGMSLLMVIAMLILHPPLLVIWITAGSVLQLLAIFLITLKWKISGHAAAISTLSVLMVLFFGSAALTAFLLVPIVVWARLRLRRHTPLQTVAGTALGLSLLLGVTLLF